MNSICMASYNGSKHIIEQLDSIIKQISDDDEIIICDDGSTDGTVEVIKNKYGSRVKVYVNDVNLGYIRNFEKSLSLATGDVIFLTDQDDVWIEGRYKLMLQSLSLNDVEIVVGHFNTFVEDIKKAEPHTIKILPGKRNKYQNLIAMLLGKTPYYGCCMAFNKEILNTYIPFPSTIVSHDHWLALIGNLLGVIYHIEQPVTNRRLHENNVTTTKRSFLDKIKTRVNWLVAIYKFIIR